MFVNPVADQFNIHDGIRRPRPAAKAKLMPGGGGCRGDLEPAAAAGGVEVS